MDKEKLDALMENLEGKMEDLKAEMKDLQLSFSSFGDSAVNDSSGHRKVYTFRFNRKPSCPRIRIHENPGAFNYNFEMPDIPDFPELPRIIEREWGNGPERYLHGPEIMTIPKRGESLSDVLGNIPMSRVKSYKIIDKKGGKRIIIDLDDGISDPGGMIYIQGQSHSTRSPKGIGHQKDARQPDQQTAPSGPDQKKSQPDIPKI